MSSPLIHHVTYIIEKANSFVGTAEYVSPELLQSKVAYKRYVHIIRTYMCTCVWTCTYTTMAQLLINIPDKEHLYLVSHPPIFKMRADGFYFSV